MTDAANSNANRNALQKPLPAWITSGVLGIVVGGGATFLALYSLGYVKSEIAMSSEGPPPGSMPGGPGMMGGGGMGGGGMGGGGPRGKRNLTTLGGKLDLAGKGVAIALDGEQSAKLAAQLAELEQPEKMSQEEAQERCDALEQILTDEQKEKLASFELPRTGRGGGGGGMMAGAGGMMGGGGPGGMGGAPPAGMGGGPPAGMGGGPPDDSNPFQQDTNRGRLHSLLERLQGAPAEKAVAPATEGDAS